MFEVAPAVGSGANYQIKNSLRFNSADSAYMSRTQASAGNRTTWTLSMWVKRSAVSGAVTYTLLESGTGSQPYTVIAFYNDIIQWDEIVPTNSVVARKFTTPVFRDPASWYHLVFCWDSGNATATDRQRLYVNGTRVTSFSSTTDPSLSATSQFNGATATNIGTSLGVSASLDAYLAEVNFVDGQSLSPSVFGKTDSVTGQWVAKKYTGTYGTNGFYLPFNDNTSTTTLGYDRSGNGNNWTLNNFNVTSGVNNDWMQDTPTNNYCTLNPLKNYGGTVSNGSLRVAMPASTAAYQAHSSIGVSSGKWYWEVTIEATGSYGALIGISKSSTTGTAASTNGDSYLYYTYNGNKQNTSNVAYGAGATVNDIIGVALDSDAGTLEFFKNGTSLGQAFTSLTGIEFTPVIYHDGASGGGATTSSNFGQRAFAYTPPTGFKALCTKNLPTPTIKKPNQYFDVKTYTGNGATQSITGLNFQPDFVWLKSRSFVQSNNLYDAARGVTKALYSDLTYAETTDANGLTSFNADGFSIGSSAGSNQNTSTYVAWNWKAGGAPVTNTDGAISSQVSANVTAGFSVVTFTGDGATSTTVGHGLGAAPQLYFIAPRNATGGFAMVHILFDGTVDYMFLNSTAANGNASQTVPTSTVFNVRADAAENTSGRQNVVYCFAEKAGFSKFGKYTGNGSADGPFMYCGFKPRYLLIKRMDTTASWYVTDGVRDIINEEQLFLYPNLSNAESTGTAGVYREDFLSNGFKLRGTGADINASGGTYIFLAFAESPFKYSTAR